MAFSLPEGGELDPRSLFDRRPRAVWLEIGFGGGEHLAAQAAAHPEIGFIGVEPFVSGVARLLAACEAAALGNVRVLVDDARLLLAALPAGSIDRTFILFPDPWPKVRHHKRRIVSSGTVADLARVLAPGAELRLATDDPAYARWMLEALVREPRLAWLAERARDWRARPDDWPPTRYEAKALAAGRRPVYLRFLRRPAHSAVATEDLAGRTGDLRHRSESRI
jgi:tRNA (guanine-N7-)-methyltransferase